jgi:hypothetical protein
LRRQLQHSLKVSHHRHVDYHPCDLILALLYQFGLKLDF